MPAHAPGDQYAAYAVAIQDTDRLAVTLLETTKLSNEQQDNLFEAVTLIDNSCNFVIQNQGCGNHALHGLQSRIDGRIQQQSFHGQLPRRSISHGRTSKDLNKEFEKERHRTLAKLYRIARKGNQDSILKWLPQYPGTFTCPACKTVQQIDYER